MKKLDYENISTEEITSGEYDAEEVKMWQAFHDGKRREKAAEAEAAAKVIKDTVNDPFNLVVQKYEKR